SALAGEGLDEAVAALRSFALVDRETIPDESDPAFTTDCIRLHRLVRQVAAGCRDAEAQDDARRVLIEALAAVYPGEVFNHPKSWLRARRLNALMLFLVGEDSRLPSQSEARAAYLLNNLGSYHHGAIAAYHDARRDFERALAMREKVFGQDHLLTAVSLNNLALLLQECGDLSAARPLYERALAIREKRRGPEHCDTATSLNNLAFLLKLEGDLLGARSLYERALTIYQNVLGLEHPLTATALNNLGRLLQAQGDFEGALPLFESALAIHERLNGPEHPLTAIALANLGRLLQDQGDLNGAAASGACIVNSREGARS